jgi:hypothetical protein
MIAQGFGFTRDFLKERNNRAYFRLKKIPCGFKEQARARHPGEKCGLAIAINTGTNLPSVATPNGQAAFLFLLTSALAPLIRLSYMTMLWMALPYTILLSTVDMIAIYTAF